MGEKENSALVAKEKDNHLMNELEENTKYFGTSTNIQSSKLLFNTIFLFVPTNLTRIQCRIHNGAYSDKCQFVQYSMENFKSNSKKFYPPNMQRNAHFSKKNVVAENNSHM